MYEPSDGWVQSQLSRFYSALRSRPKPAYTITAHARPRQRKLNYIPGGTTPQLVIAPEDAGVRMNGSARTYR